MAVLAQRSSLFWANKNHNDRYTAILEHIFNKFFPGRFRIISILKYVKPMKPIPQTDATVRTLATKIFSIRLTHHQRRSGFYSIEKWRVDDASYSQSGANNALGEWLPTFTIDSVRRRISKSKHCVELVIISLIADRMDFWNLLALTKTDVRHHLWRKEENYL